MARPPKLEHPDAFAHRLRILALLGAVSAQERIDMEVAHRWIWEQMHPSKEQQEANAFMRKLKNRQGTIAPDFAELYRRKAEIDGR